MFIAKCDFHTDFKDYYKGQEVPADVAAAYPDKIEGGVKEEKPAAPAPKKAKPKVEVVEEVVEETVELLTEVSAPVDVLVQEELEAAPEAPAVAVSAPKPSSKKKPDLTLRKIVKNAVTK